MSKRITHRIRLAASWSIKPRVKRRRGQSQKIKGIGKSISVFLGPSGRRECSNTVQGKEREKQSKTFLKVFQRQHFRKSMPLPGRRHVHFGVTAWTELLSLDRPLFLRELIKLHDICLSSRLFVKRVNVLLSQSLGENYWLKIAFFTKLQHHQRVAQNFPT